MTNDIRKSLESIKSLLNEKGKSPMTSTTASPPTSSSLHHHQSSNPHPNGASNYLSLHSPSLSLSSPQTPATQATLPSDQRLFQQQETSSIGRNATDHTSIMSNNTHHSARYQLGSSNSSSGSGGSDRRQYQDSERSSSICNFSNSTPFQITDAASSLVFSGGTTLGDNNRNGGHSGGGGAVIGSPLSAFSAVNGGSGSASSYGWNDVKQLHLPTNSDGGLLDRSSLLGNKSNSGGGGGRETMSLLVSPPSARVVEDTGGNVTASSSIMTPKENDVVVVENRNPNAKDPTPYQYRGNPPARDYSVRSSHQQYQQHHQQQHSSSSHGRPQQREEHRYSTNTSASSSRSVDPPAKSPFGSVIPAGGGGQHYRSHQSQPSQQHFHSQASTPNPSHSHPITELSIIEEDENHFDNHLNHSHTSTVTGFTLPRTPILRDIKNTVNSSTHSGGRGVTTNNNNNGSVAFTTHSTPAANSTTNTPYSTDKLLRRPSAAMRDSFQQLASQTAHQLEDIWDIVGIVPEERASQLADLVDRIAALCQEKIDQEEQLADQFRKEIAEARLEWEEGCAVLRIEEEDPLVKMKRDPSVNGALGVSLQSEYEVMMGRLEIVRGRREAATEDIVASQRRIHEAYAALNGCTLEEAQESAEMEAWADTKTNLTEEQREMFSAKAVEYEESVSSRTQAVVSLLVDCQNLIRELEIVPPGCEGRDDSSEGYVEVGQNDDDFKIMNSLKSIERSNSDDGRPRSRGKSSDSYTVTSLFESSSCMGIGKDALDRLTSRISELNGEKRRRRNKLGEMGAAIASLWSMLRVPPEEQRAFTKSIRGLGMDTLDKGERELSRLHELKAVMIGKLIREQRQAIEELWERTNASDGEKASFDKYFHVNDEDKLTDELLAKHEEYVGALNAKLEKMQPILDLIERRETIIEERVELEMLQKDPDRLKGRNASKQLMKEEKMMRRVQKELPKITQHLEKKLKEWYVTNKPSQTDDDVRDEDWGHFMYKGLPYLRTIKTQEHEWLTRKERGEKERQRKRQEERSTSSGSAFGSTYSKLPGKKWNPPPSDASNMRPGSRGLRPGDVNRVNRPGEKSTKPTVSSKSSGYGARAASAPRMRL